MSNHLSAINTWKDTSVAKHFMSHGHCVEEHFKIGIIDHTRGNIAHLKIREGFWIYTLQAVTKGINEKEEANQIMDYQILNHSKHFRHSKTCAPYLKFNLTAMMTDHLKAYKRTIIKPCRRITASAPVPQIATDRRKGISDIRRWLTRFVTLQTNHTDALDVNGTTKRGAPS
jgi:hypothetical protein